MRRFAFPAIASCALLLLAFCALPVTVRAEEPDAEPSSTLVISWETSDAVLHRSRVCRWDGERLCYVPAAQSEPVNYDASVPATAYITLTGHTDKPLTYTITYTGAPGVTAQEHGIGGSPTGVLDAEAETIFADYRSEVRLTHMDEPLLEKLAAGECVEIGSFTVTVSEPQSACLLRLESGDHGSLASDTLSSEENSFRLPIPEVQENWRFRGWAKSADAEEPDYGVDILTDEENPFFYCVDEASGCPNTLYALYEEIPEDEKLPEELSEEPAEEPAEDPPTEDPPTEEPPTEDPPTEEPPAEAPSENPQTSPEEKSADIP